MIENTLMSGQTFQWFERNGKYYTTIRERGVELEVTDDGIKVTPRELESEVQDRIGLSEDMEEVYESITIDDFMNKCVNKYRGMTLVEDLFSLL